MTMRGSWASGPARLGLPREAVGIADYVVHYTDRRGFQETDKRWLQTDITGALARTMQMLRTERGWSLDQLATRSGVSKGVLVALEQGRSNPNLATLARISDAFGVPVTRLVELTSEPEVRMTGPGQARVLWHGPSGGTGTIIAATEAPWAAELWRWTVQPGEGWGGDAHTPATRELVWVGIRDADADRGRPRRIRSRPVTAPGSRAACRTLTVTTGRSRCP